MKSVPLVALLAIVVGCSPAADRPTLVGVQPGPSASNAASARVPPIRYSLPSCPLRYEMRNVDTTAMEGFHEEGGPQGIETFVTATFTPEKGRLVVTGSLSSSLKRGKYRPYSVPVEGYAPANVGTDGARWTEQDGPTTLWDSFGTIEGLGWLFPDLPPSGATGSLAEWSIARHTQAETTKVEAARGSLPGAKEAAAQIAAEPVVVIEPVKLDVRLVRWTEVAGTKVAELEAKGSRKDSEKSDMGGPFGSMSSIQNATYLGTFAVTSAGRLLRAKMVKDTTVDLTVAHDGKDSVQHHTQRSVHELALVGACDGPVEASLATPLSPEEKAIHAWGDAFVAIAKGEREKALASFDPALRKSVGDAKLWDGLVDYKKLRGDHALPPPLMITDREVVVDGTDIRLTTHGGALQAAAHVNHQVELVVTLHEANGAWSIGALHADLWVGRDKRPILDVSKKGIDVRKGWPPSW